MISFKVEIGINDVVQGFAHLQADLPKQIEQARKRLTDIILKEVKDQTPVRTGALQKSLHWVTVGNIDILYGLRYGEWVITGTRPHIIKPKNKKFLRFVIDGEVIFAKQVKHPGTKPNDFRRKGLDNADFSEVLQDLSDWIKAQVAN